MNERITATPLPPPSGDGSATAGPPSWCDWWPWLWAIEPHRVWSDQTPLPPASVSSGTH